MGAGRQAALSYGVRMRTLARALRSLKACDAPPSDNGCRAAKARHGGLHERLTDACHDRPPGLWPGRRRILDAPDIDECRAASLRRCADAPMRRCSSTSLPSSTAIRCAGNATAHATLPSRTDPNVLELGGSGNGSNTPTVTYQPLLGDRFTKSLLQPIPPVAVFQLLQGGWPASLVFRTVVGSVNGLRNASAGVASDPGFDELSEALSRVQRVGSIGIKGRCPTRGTGTGSTTTMSRASAPSRS